MGAAGFGRMVDQAMREKDYSAGYVAVAIGVLSDGKVWDTTRVQRLRRGQVRHVTRELVDRLVDVLGLDPFEAYEAADLRPEGFTAEDHRTFAAAGGTMIADQPGPFTSRLLAFPGQRVRPQGRRAARLPLVLHAPKPGLALFGH